MGLIEASSRVRSLILQIDDSALVLMVIEAMLVGLGYDTIQADNGEDALVVAASKKPDMILIDALMPGIDGYETVRRMRLNAELKETPILMLTGDDNDRSLDRAMACGANGCLVKPVNEQLLKIKLTALLGKPSR